MFSSPDKNSLEAGQSVSRWSALDIKSRIFWRIAAGIFVSILLIEFALLLFSWFTERERLIERLDETVSTVVGSLDQENPVPQLRNLLDKQTADTNYKISGFIHLSASGVRTTGGNIEDITRSVSLTKPEIYDSSADAYFKLVSLDSTTSNKQQLWLRVDAHWLSKYMRGYVVRILGMVILISLFVTLACLFFLQPILLNPLLRLNRLLVRGESKGIESAIAEPLDLRRKDELGSVFRSFNLLRDQLVQAKVSSAEVTDRFEQLASMGADCFWELDRLTEFTYVAGDTQKLFNLHPDDIKGQTIDQFVTSMASRMPDADSVIPSLLNGEFWEGKIYKEESGKGLPTAVRIASVPRMTSDGGIDGFRGTIKDVTKEVQLSEELVFQATHDELTRLCNRRELSNRLQIALDQFKADGTTFSFMVLDLDHFKTINDASGHLAGDTLLKTISDTLVSLVDEGDVVARLGGDEFAIILQSKGADEARRVAEYIRDSIEKLPFVWEQNAYSLSVSIGLAEVSVALDTPENITTSADSCCIVAKRNGRNQVRVYSADEESEKLLKNESLWISKIMESLETDKFSLFRQLIVPVDPDSDEDHFEILVRMQNPEGGFYTPDKFLPIAERNDLMPKIDQWVADNSLLWLTRQNLAPDSNFCMNINLSAASLSDHNFREYLRNRVSATTAVNHFVCFEVTESAAMTNYQETVSFLQDLKEQGCTIALDDFGTGFSSLSHIRTLPLDYIKIDGVFIQEIVNNQLDQAVVSSVASIAKVLNIRTVAEFVDSNEALQKLRELEIDFAQGYLFSKPEPLQDLDSASESKAA